MKTIMENVLLTFLEELNSFELLDKESGRGTGLVELNKVENLMELLEVAIRNEYQCEAVQRIFDSERNFKTLRGERNYENKFEVGV